MVQMTEYLSFLNFLNDNQIEFHLEKVRPDAVMVEVYFQDEIWEIEFTNWGGEAEAGEIVVEKFNKDSSYNESFEKLLLEISEE